jgi:hypothetical protein
MSDSSVDGDGDGDVAARSKNVLGEPQSVWSDEVMTG